MKTMTSSMSYPAGEHHPRHIEVIGGRVAGHASIEEIVLREVGRNSADIAVAPRQLALGEGIAQHENSRPAIGQGNLPDLLVAKAETVGEELIRIAAPVVDEGAIGLEGVMAHRVRDSTIFHLRAGCGGRRTAALWKQSRVRNAASAEGYGSQKRDQLHRALAAAIADRARFVRVHLERTVALSFMGQLASGAGVCTA